MANELAVFNVSLPSTNLDKDIVAELTQEMTAGIGGSFKRSPRLMMTNGGDWVVIDEHGERTVIGRQANFVIVNQRPYVSRIHYPSAYNQNDEDRLPADCYSYDGVKPDDNVEKPLCHSCKECKALELSGQKCAYYRRLVVVLAQPNGEFSDPLVLEAKSLSLFNDKVVKTPNGVFGSLTWYLNGLAKNTVNGVHCPVAVQTVVTTAIPEPGQSVVTMRFNVGSLPNGGYWVLNQEQINHILELRNSEYVKDLLKPFNAADSNPMGGESIPVMNIDVNKASEPEAKAEPAPKPAPKSAPKPAPKSAPKPAPKPAPKVKKVVLGIEHPDVKNSADFDYEDIKAWAAESSEEDVKDWLAENFPQALEPVEVKEEEPEVPEEQAKPAPKKRTPKKATKEPAPEVVKNEEENVIDTSGAAVDPELAKKANELAGQLDDFDD